VITAEPAEGEGIEKPDRRQLELRAPPHVAGAEAHRAAPACERVVDHLAHPAMSAHAGAERISSASAWRYSPSRLPIGSYPARHQHLFDGIMLPCPGLDQTCRQQLKGLTMGGLVGGICRGVTPYVHFRVWTNSSTLPVTTGSPPPLSNCLCSSSPPNDRKLSQDQVIFESNARCNQENLIEQLKNGVRALHAPVNTLHANWAYMVIASLAWTMKVWSGLLLPVSPRWRQAHDAEREAIGRMDFRTIA
jgi:hypothetical protein